MNNTNAPPLTPVASDARGWAQILARYRAPSPMRSTVELVITAVPLVLLWFLMWATLDLGYWLSLVLAVPAAGFLVRLFMIQHDCGHGAFFHRRSTNDWVGRVIGVLTLTPYDFWRRKHAIHHSTSGNLDRRGIGDIDTLTVREYLARSRWGQLGYRVYRHPLVMFGLGPAFLFILEHRLPVGLMRNGWMPWLSTMATNFAIATLAAAIIWFVGIGAFLLVHLPVMLLAASAGVLAVLCPAPVREYRMGSRPSLEPARGGASRQLALCPAGLLALVHRQYRRSPHPPFVQPYSLLPTAARAARPPEPRRHRPVDPASELQVCATGAVGRRPPAPRLFPRNAQELYSA